MFSRINKERAEKERRDGDGGTGGVELHTTLSREAVKNKINKKLAESLDTWAVVNHALLLANSVSP